MENAIENIEHENVEQLDLFTVLDAGVNWPVKDDIHSMEHPIFSLSKTKDLRIRTYHRGSRYIKIIPSVIGAATVFDKDIVLYAVSQIVRAAEASQPHSRRVRFAVRPFLTGTKRSTGLPSYARVVDACKRLRGTTIETNIKTTEKELTEGFGLIEDYKVTQYGKNKSALEVEITLSEWLYRAVLSYDILTIHPNYFSLSQPLKRRLYEIARKHCGDKAVWKIGVDLLQEKTGSVRESKYFRRELRAIIVDDDLPDYRIFIDEKSTQKQVYFFTRQSKKLSDELVKDRSLLAIYHRLTQGKIKNV